MVGETCMNELSNTKTEYYVNIEGNTTTVNSNCRIHVEDSYYDYCSRLWVFAIKAYDYDSDYSYHIDYLFLDSSYNLVHSFQEECGVNPNFIVSPDKDLWIELDSTLAEKEGSIVIPLFNRQRIEEPKAQRSVGMDYSFVFLDMYYAYSVDLFDSRKDDNLYLYQFDKNHRFKSKKRIKINGIRDGNPVVINNRCHIAHLKRTDGSQIVCVSEINKKGDILNIWESKTINDINNVFLTSFDDDYIRVTVSTNHSIDHIIFSKDGCISQRQVLFETDRRINYIMVRDNSVVFVDDEESGPSNTKNCIMKLETDSYPFVFQNGFHPKYLDKNHFVLTGIRDDKTEFRIVEY